MAEVDLELRRLQWDCYMHSQRLIRLMERRLLDSFRQLGHSDMSVARLQVLTVLFQKRGPATAQAIATDLGLSPVTVGRFVRALQQGGWVERQDDPRDGRALLLAPTAKARAHLQAFLQVSDECMDEAYQGIERAEIAGWTAHLRRLVAQLTPPQEA